MGEESGEIQFLHACLGSGCSGCQAILTHPEGGMAAVHSEAYSGT